METARFCGVMNRVSGFACHQISASATALICRRTDEEAVEA
jgi:hypothetical protein